MRKGDSQSLLLEEIKELITKTRELRDKFNDSPLESADAEYAKTWYVFNLVALHNYLIATGTYLGKLLGRNESWDDLDTGPLATEAPGFLEDLCHAHSEFASAYKATVLAYADTLEDDRVLLVLSSDMDKHFRLMDKNLDQIKLCV